MTGSPTRLLAGLALLATFVLQPATRAQSGADRLYAELTRYPALGTAVWTADFNGDGNPDLVSGSLSGGSIGSPSSLQILIGQGDGTFGAPQVAAASNFEPVGTGDLNQDGATDILAQRAVGSARESWVIPGRGDGRFGAPFPLAVPPLRAPTHVVDINRDGHPDLVTSGDTDVLFYPGQGNATFGAPSVLPCPGGTARNPIVVDVDGDTFDDIVAVCAVPAGLHAFVYSGSNSFSHLTITLSESALAVAAGDLNADGFVDLVVSTGTRADTGTPGRYFVSGSIRVLLGRGNLAFDDGGTYGTEDGPVSVVIGDVDGDGISDVATGNSSPHFICMDDLDGWDSVSLFRGQGNGALGARTSIALYDATLTSESFRYQNRIDRLQVTDLDRDGRVDLIAAPGAVLLSRPRPANSAPLAVAGPSRIQSDWRDEAVYLKGSATDPEHDLLTFEWTDETGRRVGGAPWQCIDQSYIGTHTFTLTVKDGHGGESTDSMQLTLSYGDDPLPAGWNATDVGNPGASGFTVYAGWAGPIDVAPITVTGAGHDIWDTSDSFQFSAVAREGDFDVSAHVLDVQDVHEWTKAGLMVRESLSPDARHASVFVTPRTHGIAFQRRPETGGPSVHTQGPMTGAPVWIRLKRVGDTVTAFFRVSENEPWTEIGAQALPGLADSVHVGLAITSHMEGRLASAYISDVTSAVTGTLPVGWHSDDVGPTEGKGGGVFASGQVVVQGSGADIWDQQDAFHFTYVPVSGDFIALVPVWDLAGPDPWSKAGLMLRESLDAASPHYFLLVSEANGLAYQRRLSAGDITHHTTIAGSSHQPWFLIKRAGPTVTFEYSANPDDPASWQVVGQETLMSPQLLLGLAVTSHREGQLATATFGEPIVSPGVGTAPSVSFSGAAAFSNMRDVDIRVLASAVDRDHGIAEVFFEIATSSGWQTVARGERLSPSSPSFTATFRHSVPGLLQARARAVDRAGIEAVSSTRIIEVVDTPPPEWVGEDIGATGFQGHHSQSSFDGSFFLVASGADIWGTTDAFRFTYTSLPGDGSIVARVSSLNGLNPWTKVGVMMRLSTSPSSPHAFMLFSRDHGLAFQRRAIPGGLSTHTAGPADARWLKLTRIGDLVVASASADGVTWTVVDSESLPVGPSAPILVGMALTSHDNDAKASASLVNVRITAD